MSVKHKREYYRFMQGVVLLSKYVSNSNSVRADGGVIVEALGANNVNREDTEALVGLGWIVENNRWVWHPKR